MTVLLFFIPHFLFLFCRQIQMRESSFDEGIWFHFSVDVLLLFWLLFVSWQVILLEASEACRFVQHADMLAKQIVINHQVQCLDLQSSSISAFGIFHISDRWLTQQTTTRKTIYPNKLQLYIPFKVSLSGSCSEQGVQPHLLPQGSWSSGLFFAATTMYRNMPKFTCWTENSVLVAYVLWLWSVLGVVWLLSVFVCLWVAWLLSVLCVRV